MRERVRLRAVAMLVVAVGMSVLAGCSAAGAGGGASGDGATVRVAIVANPQMEDVQKLTTVFERENPGIDVDYVTLPENEARQKITQSVATQGGEFDVVMISNYETPQWARNGWLVDLEPYMERTPGYDREDFVPSVRESLTYEGKMHSVPFYGESSFLMYRKDLFEEAGLEMPARPTWSQVARFAAKLDDPDAGRAGICLRGLPGWGENIAPITTVLNTFGGRWFSPDWKAQLDSPEARRAIDFYVDLVRDHGQPGAAAGGFTECLTQYSQGDAAMWYDATVAAGSLEDEETSTVVGKNGYAPAPVEKTDAAGWLYTWSLGIPATSEVKDEAWKFVAWATSKEYIQLVGDRLGWSALPPGSRESTYEIPQYRKAAEGFAQPTLEALEAVGRRPPTAEPVPYRGVQFVGIPEFQDLGTRVGQQFAAAIAGQKPVSEALDQAQRYAETVGETYGR